MFSYLKHGFHGSSIRPWLHKLHDGGFHLEAVIVSNDFEGDNLIQRHRKVYEAMGELMNHEIHALSMKTLTSTEWEAK